MAGANFLNAVPQSQSPKPFLRATCMTPNYCKYYTSILIYVDANYHPYRSVVVHIITPLLQYVPPPLNLTP